MTFELFNSSDAGFQIGKIMSDPSKIGLAKQLKKALGYLSRDPNYPGLQSHPVSQFDSLFGAKVFSSYVQNYTPAAHRILWVYGPKVRQITVVAVMPHY
jgi:hypothetical protein